MSRDRFKQILVALRFDDPLSRHAFVKKDKLTHIRNVLNLWVPLLFANYVPGENVTVDEQLLPFKGRCHFKQYMPNKPRSKYGLKIFMVCDINGYCLNFQIYVGRTTDGPPEKNQGQRVVMDMVEPFGCNSGRNVYMDNFFTSLQLAEKLWERNMTLIGTIRKNKAEVPLQFLPHKDRAVYSSLFGYHEQYTIVSYVPRARRAVILLSTLHHDSEIDETLVNNDGKQLNKPEIILDYNKGKAGVDLLDQIISYNSVKRKCRRWPMAVFFGIVDVSLHNSFVIWDNINPGWNIASPHRRRTFLRKVGYALITPQLLNRRNVKTLHIDIKCQIDVVLNFLEIPLPTKSAEPSPAVLTKLTSRVRCKPCYDSERRTSCTSTCCAGCQVPVCGKHTIRLCQLCAKGNLDSDSETLE
ncbi:piggyBac transposable element-derived protein 4-like [Paramacrobiotus metropolitanus]|uniref:piggyBac transposable element-derived protein 4-like n=1 Tax=Paramacrobiotus metropolitanus TaxID=2943436 RepID=UPI002445DED5|nr:piggyBac transposable element-derived protein 4-like [Paramacrobiotus metropolitanus]